MFLDHPHLEAGYLWPLHSADSGKDHGKVTVRGAKISSVLAIPMRRIDSRKKSIDSLKSAQSGLDTLRTE